MRILDLTPVERKGITSEFIVSHSRFMIRPCKSQAQGPIGARNSPARISNGAARTVRLTCEAKQTDAGEHMLKETKKEEVCSRASRDSRVITIQRIRFMDMIAQVCVRYP